MNSFANRVKKNLKTIVPWARRFPCNAYRIYDKDIPEYAVTVDFYAGHLVVNRYQNDRFSERDDRHFVEVFQALMEIFGIPADRIFVKVRARQKGLAQYEKLSVQSVNVVVQEGPLQFITNLSDYLDTGLFLDHRSSRRWVCENSKGKRVLNLFCYTGTVSANAISGGAVQVVSVDLSQTYLDWAAENMRLNRFNPADHPLVQADVLNWLKTRPAGEKYDLIFLDPPSFSNSKRMDSSFDVQRDHADLIRTCMALVDQSGTLFFSNNLRSFKLDSGLLEEFAFTDLTKRTLPPDFRNELIHRAWTITHRR